jgi:hypothetical protein
MVFDLGIVVLKLVLHILFKLSSYLLPRHLSSSLIPLHLVIKTGISKNPLIFILFSLEVTREASLMVKSFITEMRGVIAKVKVVLTPHCVALVTLVVGFSQATICAITHST